MMRATLQRLFAALCLFVLLSENVGYVAHIYTEDPERYAGYFEDLLPENDSDSGVAALCPIDNFYFFPFLEDVQPPFEFYLSALTLPQPEQTCCKFNSTCLVVSLRAPPTA